MSSNLKRQQRKMRREITRQLHDYGRELRELTGTRDKCQRLVRRYEERIEVLSKLKELHSHDTWDLNSDLDSDATSSSESESSSSEETDTDEEEEIDEDEETDDESSTVEENTGDETTKDTKCEPQTDTFFQVQEAWQIERHVQWGACLSTWPKEKICSVFNIRTAEELARGEPECAGNIGLNSDVCKYDTENTPFGRPTQALLKALAHSWNHLCKDTKTWLYSKESRELLNCMENWYFSLPSDERKSVPENVWDWELPDCHVLLWNRASGASSQTMNK